ncbi:MAG: hypoxanthine phosphoribosyltransferase [Firmicutes bacterium]|nr:hypoxanthine phosphoribosyltransferase [Bacillota bacterium]
MYIPEEIIKILLTEEQIRQRVAGLGAQITAEYKGTGRPLLLVGILRGGIVFLSDLMRRIEIDTLKVDFMAVSSYGCTASSSGEPRILKDLDESAEGCDVIVVEDIADTGVTLACLKKMLSARNPASLKVCCLLDKPSRREAELNADYIGFTIPDEFVVGYGLDYAQKYRHLPYIGVISL